MFGICISFLTVELSLTKFSRCFIQVFIAFLAGSWHLALNFMFLLSLYINVCL